MIPVTPQQYLGNSGAGSSAPSPSRPAAPAPVGTQDSPILSGQKRGVVLAPVPTQPKPKRKLAWWEADWANVARSTKFQQVKQEVLAEDLPNARTPAPVSEAAYSDVIGVVRQRTAQGYQLRAEQTEREGLPLIRNYVTRSQADFPAVRLEGLLRVVEPQVNREAVPPGFADLGPVEGFTDVKTLYR